MSEKSTYNPTAYPTLKCYLEKVEEENRKLREALKHIRDDSKDRLLDYRIASRVLKELRD